MAESVRERKSESETARKEARGNEGESTLARIHTQTDTNLKSDANTRAHGYTPTHTRADIPTNRHAHVVSINRGCVIIDAPRRPRLLVSRRHRHGRFVHVCVFTNYKEKKEKEKEKEKGTFRT